MHYNNNYYIVYLFDQLQINIACINKVNNRTGCYKTMTLPQVVLTRRANAVAQGSGWLSVCLSVFILETASWINTQFNVKRHITHIPRPI